MSLSQFRLIRLTQDHFIKPFNCDDDDLNDFLLNDSKNYQDQLLAVTYILESDIDTVAFFSLLNDKISYDETDSKSKWKRICKIIPYNKRGLKSLPAMKIGRLAVNSNYKNQNIGTSILDYLKKLFIDNNRTGCRFITVDAYKDSLKFYEKNGFKYLTNLDINNDTRLMYFDLNQLLF